MEILNSIFQWIIAPVVAFVWMLHRQLQSQGTDIAVLKALVAANKEAHDREFKEMHDSFKAVMDKLESIEQHLRK